MFSWKKYIKEFEHTYNMPLQSLVAAVKKNAQIQEQQAETENEYKYKKAIPRYIVADSEEWQKKTKAVDWLQCKHLKQTSEKSFCIKFCAMCAKEKCNSKFME